MKRIKSYGIFYRDDNGELWGLCEHGYSMQWHKGQVRAWNLSQLRYRISNGTPGNSLYSVGHHTSDLKTSADGHRRFVMRLGAKKNRLKIDWKKFWVFSKNPKKRNDKGNWYNVRNVDFEEIPILADK